MQLAAGGLPVRRRGKYRKRKKFDEMGHLHFLLDEMALNRGWIYLQTVDRRKRREKKGNYPKTELQNRKIHCISEGACPSDLARMLFSSWLGRWWEDLVPRMHRMMERRIANERRQRTTPWQLTNVTCRILLQHYSVWERDHTKVECIRMVRPWPDQPDQFWSLCQ